IVWLSESKRLAEEDDCPVGASSASAAPFTGLGVKNGGEPAPACKACKSLRISDACRYRRFRSFSRHLLIMCCRPTATWGFRSIGGAGLSCTIDRNNSPV